MTSLRIHRDAALVAILVAATLASCDSPTSAPADTDLASSMRPGGATTIDNATSNAFSMPAPNLSPADLDMHVVGDAAFEARFVTPPAAVHGGLGPVFNNVSCINCHVRDGRGRPDLGTLDSPLLFRLSLPGAAANGGPVPVPGFGTQLQQHAVIGAEPEADVVVSYTDVSGSFADGTPYSLRRPEYVLTAPYRSMPATVMVSPRIAPPVFGLGLLEAVPESSIMARSDPADADADGISGRPNMVWSVAEGRTVLGRFGWKANVPTLIEQTAGAYNEDMGVTSPLLPFESCHEQPQFEHGGSSSPEINAETLNAVAQYVRTLAVPAARNLDDPVVRHGRALFDQAGCAGCHTPTLTTGTSDIGALSEQTIHPYTDLLLHDMGEGLADNRPDFLATGSEWRTPPLWGIGLTRTVNGHTFFLHDGRARSLSEAILWHGGEAESSRTFFLGLDKSDRDALLAFVSAI